VRTRALGKPFLDADRIVLIGFMGSGKSTVGRLLADELGWTFVDTDAMLEAQARADIPRIFREQGERAFRDMEAGVLSSLESRTGIVVATGGGAPAQAGNRGFFSGNILVFHLRVSLESVQLRTRGSRERPLLSLGESALHSLYESRRPIYESMGTGVETDGRNPRDIAQEIIGKLRNPSRSTGSADSG
jgi:shikimate kinase